MNLRKAARFAIVINTAQIVTMLAVLFYVWLSDKSSDRIVEIGVLALGLMIVSLGAVLDIREAKNAQRIATQSEMLEEAYRQLETLNGTLRSQRHDFKNHLQVVFSLMELEEYKEALEYVENIYRDIQHTGSALKTAIPAVNALIAAKRTECDENGIQLITTVNAGWQGMPVPGWEMCRILGNLIDNARDAILEIPNLKDPKIEVLIDECPGAFVFSVSNNGPAIPAERMGDLFRMGYTTKREGHGSGLAIVHEILDAHDGEITVTSDPSLTMFKGSIPRGHD